MSVVPVYGLGRATAGQIAAHLHACDHGFLPWLSERVDIDDYARKVADKAACFEAWADGVLVGLVAAYCNDPDRHCAFITSVSVTDDWQGRGVASQLVRHCLERVRDLGFARIELEVDTRSQGAVALYAKRGFETIRTAGTLATMHLQLR